MFYEAEKDLHPFVGCREASGFANLASCITFCYKEEATARISFKSK